MAGTTRRAVLKALGVVGIGSGAAYGALQMEPSESAVNGSNETQATTTAERTRTNAAATPTPSTWRLGEAGQSQLSSSVGGFAEGSVRPDGRYAAVGTRFSGTGSYLVDLKDPSAPELVHHFPADDGVRCLDVKFGPEKGLYCRSNHPAGDSGVQIVDYGFAEGTPESPQIIGELNASGTHNLFVRSNESVVYAVNYGDDPNIGGIDVWDVTDPRSPQQHGTAGPPGLAHDVVYDAKRELLHCAYMGEMADGYVLLDASDPLKPNQVGHFDYDKHPSYANSEVGEEAFGNCHYALPDPRRDLVVVGDERSYGTPGGKHVFDIGWRDGSIENPIPVGFTVSPNAERMESGDDGMDDQTERFDWTGHQFDIVPLADATLVVSGDWHEGTVLYDITDPTDPHPIDSHRTDASAVPNPAEDLQVFGDPPMAYSATYNEERGFALTSDLFTGIYTYRIDGVAGTETAASTTETD
ncbi:hypothetical protein MUK72_11505 [Halococcus dombrowskii]|uniref:LVIVD repeat-containing protein n=1 Tax=Halococcus dombrowskii TaxID=179637 RepID=A0AAX3AKR3_HALDO|nr:hypothetical protein [Halococcus dombrowskii]UOO94589.1 hypothetical protein MUK72_11505 [Halococcus dombrowskii]